MKIVFKIVMFVMLFNISITLLGYMLPDTAGFVKEGLTTPDSNMGTGTLVNASSGAPVEFQSPVQDALSVVYRIIDKLTIGVSSKLYNGVSTLLYGIVGPITMFLPDGGPKENIVLALKGILSVLYVWAGVYIFTGKVVN